ncbi:ankyrin repeat domain-containing protein [Stenotrophomonas sp. GD03819]|uniref:ankyrin repeat domain-containing protein n=1 Tax=Stenotrophomonas TaxID=40323 RepID=UPI0013DB46EB|nr:MULTISPECIES: ankyrin repeat domain-containing protein [Stenotrophomonas]MDH1791537.1 ankyrin repeat domain-containing protein [Stenotrophomonas sp. GD03819]
MYIGSTIENVQDVIASGRNIHERSGITQSTALHRVVDEKFYEPGVVTALVNAGLDPNAREVNQRTPLHYARHPEAIAELIEIGANPNLGDVNGQTPLHVNLSKEKSICPMARVQALLEGGANINHADKNGVTPLLSALEARRPTEFIEALVEAGADLNAVSNDGQGVLCWSTAEGDVENTKLLIALGADINAVSNTGMSVLNYCARFEQFECARVLLDAGADPTVANADNLTPLHLLAHGPTDQWAKLMGEQPQRAELVSKMIEAGADINAVDKSGNTALHFAAQGKQDNVVRTLIDQGATVSIQNNQGMTVLDVAKQHYKHTSQGKLADEIANGEGLVSLLQNRAQKETLQEALNIQHDTPQTVSRWRRI